MSGRKRYRFPNDESLFTPRAKCAAVDQLDIRAIREKNRLEDERIQEEEETKAANPLAGLLGDYGSPLPIPWQEAIDPQSGNVYYWNRQTNQVSWQKPEGVSCLNELAPSHSTPPTEEEVEKIVNGEIELKNLEILAKLTDRETQWSDIRSQVDPSTTAIAKVPFIKNRNGELVSLVQLMEEIECRLKNLQMEFAVRKQDWKAGGLLPSYFRIKQREALEMLDSIQGDTRQCKSVMNTFCGNKQKQQI